MSDESISKVEAERQLLVNAKESGTGATLFAYMRLSGPGWLQSAITLGGGSLAGSLYLGVLGGTSLLWLQPVFMILGIVMLSAIGFVTMSTGERPFRAINKHVNPVLGWSWAIACLAANMVWCLPQFSLANSVFEQNLAPELFTDAVAGPTYGKLIIAASILVVSVLITWSYGSGHWGLKLYEILLKLMVAMIVICFFSVVWALAQKDGWSWGAILWGFIPDPTRLGRPAAGFTDVLDSIPKEFQEFWRDKIVDVQFDKMAAAAATAVGINMTFLFPYSILRKGWTKEFRGLQVFDLSTGMFIPFVLATSCVVIAASSQFHATPVPGLVGESKDGAKPTGKELAGFRKLVASRIKKDMGADKYNELVSGEAEFKALQGSNASLLQSRYSSSEVGTIKKQLGELALNREIALVPEAERKLAAMLVERDANRLAQSLAPITGSKSANYLFGVGVVGMTLSTITLLMLISGFVICEVFNLPTEGWSFRMACLPAAVGALGPFVWSKAGFALAVPTSVFGLMLLPIAYITFFILMNQKSLLKDEMPKGRQRVIWNVLMALAAGVATVSSLYMVWNKVKEKGMIAIGVLLALALLVQVYRWIRPPADDEPTAEKV